MPENISADVSAQAGEPAEEPQVAEVSLNGAQITGAIAIVSQVTAGVLTKDGAAAMLAAAFPSFSRPQIDAILAGVVEASPPQAADPAQPPQASVGDPAPAGSPDEERAAPGTIVEGNWVTFGDGEIGKVDHVMTEGVLNLGDIEVPASPDDPVMLVSVWLGGDFTGQQPVLMADAELVDEPEDARGWKPKRKPGRRKRGG